MKIKKKEEKNSLAWTKQDRTQSYDMLFKTVQIYKLDSCVT
jgi:hypothetical protein